ncbi:MAG: tRNA (adenosine(37)-N6)-threonylcarbamoyltransferase complex transferase subunit TsaD [Chitinophagaceae bacterium]|nr:tRNA (adenosine(37)-N6)-threonylcarbamoyltransferase complex transferase subunit TsaD [Chitinophagaceae bacterium]
MSDVTILAIESSCDETSAAVCHNGKMLSNVVAGQAIHEQYGGVVPELASRAHMQNILPVVDSALRKANLSPEQLSGIAYTQAPGLIGALIVGSSFAKSLALGLNLPLISVHHMQPFLCLTVSGGHTQIVLAESPNQLKILGETLDDAAGEAFDKSAKLLGLPYPGGPLIDKFAQSGNPKYSFAEPNIPGLDFSFSGIKTSILYFLQKQQKENPDFIKENIHNLCASIQQAIIKTLMKKLKRAAEQTGIRRICLAGGVSANSGLRKSFIELGSKHGWETFIPAFEYCTDNAAMIAITGYYKFLEGEFSGLDVSPSARAAWE